MNQPLALRLARPSFRAALAVLALAAIATASQAADDTAVADKPLPLALVEALNTLSGGVHPGYRANHAKGVLVTGEFTPKPTARGLSKATHFAKRVPMLVRFSDATGVPTLPDADVNAKTNDGATPLDFAESKQAVEVETFLSSVGN